MLTKVVLPLESNPADEWRLSLIEKKLNCTAPFAQFSPSLSNTEAPVHGIIARVTVRAAVSPPILKSMAVAGNLARIAAHQSLKSNSPAAALTSARSVKNELLNVRSNRIRNSARPFVIYDTIYKKPTTQSSRLQKFFSH